MTQCIQMSSGGFVRSALCVALLAGVAATAHAQRYQRYIGTSREEQPAALERTADDGFVIAGRQLVATTALGDAFVNKTNGNGIVQWTTVARDNTGSDLFGLSVREIQAALGGGYIAGAQRNTAGLLNLAMYQLNPVGAPVWANVYTANPAPGRLSVRPLGTGEFVAATQGQETNFPVATAGVFLRLAPGGALSAFARYVNLTFTPGPGAVWLSDIRPVGTSGAGFYVCGGVDVVSQPAAGGPFTVSKQMLVMQIDPVGAVIWAFAYAPPTTSPLASANQGLTGLDVSSNGDIVVTGYAFDATGVERLNVMRLTAAGGPIWLQQYPTLYTAGGFTSKNIREAPNGDLVIGCNVTTNPVGALQGPMTVLRANAGGFPISINHYGVLGAPGAFQPATNAVIVGANLNGVAIAGWKQPPAAATPGMGLNDILLARPDLAGATGCQESRSVIQPLSTTPQVTQLFIAVNRSGDYAPANLAFNQPVFGQTSVCCPGDITGDNKVDFNDLNAVLAGFGGNPYSFPNLNTVLSAFGGSCPP